MDDDTASTCTSWVHCWTDVAWWDQVRRCSKMPPYCPIPFILLSDCPSLPLSSPRPSLACPLSYMWHGCLLLPVTSQAVRWPLHFWCWQAKLEWRQPVYARVCARVLTNTHSRTHMHTHWVQGNIIQEEEEFPNDQTQAAWWVFASPRLCFLSISSSEVHHCISVYLSFPFFLLLLCIGIYISVCLGCCFSLCLSIYFSSCFTFFHFL